MNITSKEVKKIIDETVSKTVDELLQQKLIKKKDMNTYQKTEQLLYNYNNFKEVVKDKEEMIEQINMVGLPRTSNSIIPMPQDNGFRETQTETEKITSKIAALESSIALTKNYIKIIDNALKTIQDDPYYKVIEEYYFKGKKYSVIADEWLFPISDVAIGKNKTRLVKKLSIYLFSDEVIKELYS